MILTKHGWNVESLVKISLYEEEGDDRVEFEYLYCGGVIDSLSLSVCVKDVKGGISFIEIRYVPTTYSKFLDHLTTTNWQFPSRLFKCRPLFIHC